jgi:ATP-binding cassette, subfamily C, bacterial CydD
VSGALTRLVPRPVLAALAVTSAGRGILLIVQARLLATAVAHLDAGPLPWLALAVAGRAGLTWLAGLIAGRGAAAIKQQLRAGLARRAGALNRAGAAETTAGGFATLMSSGLDALDASLSGYVPQLTLAATVPPLVLAQLFLADPVSGFIVTATLPLIPLFGALIGMHTRDATTAQWGHLQRLGGHFRDVVTGLSTLRVFERTEFQDTVITEMARAHRRATTRALRIAFLSGFVMELVGSLSVALVAVPVGLRLLNGRMSLTTALLVLLLAPEAFGPLRAMGAKFHAGAAGMAVLDQVTRILGPADPAGTAPRVPVAPVVAPAGLDIRLDHVTVSFPGRDTPALDDVCLTIHPGDRVAVIGPSGAGKSTLLHLLLGFASPASGRVLIGGTDQRDLDLEEWRSQLAWLPQRPHLLAATIADNIRLGNPGASDAELRAATRAGCAEQFIAALPDGLDTPLRENGAGLSAGQRPRVALARAYLRGAPVVLLDEPTARLDMASEDDVVTATAQLLRGRTAVMVAHRPAILAIAQRVLLVEDGRVRELTGNATEVAA